MTQKKIVAVDLFCGVGGLTFGLERSGIEVRLGVDIEAACQHPLVKNTRAKFLHADVLNLRAENILEVFDNQKINLLAGCAPCQPFSTYSRSSKKSAREAEHAAGQSDWALVERFGWLVRKTKPDLVTMENVPPLQYTPVFQKLLSDLSDYYIDYRVVECAAIGLPQARKRLVLVASKLGDIQWPEMSFERSTVRQTISHLPRISAGGQDPNDSLHRASKLSKTNTKRIKASVPGGTWRDWPQSLRAKCHNKDSGATYPSVYGRMEWDKPSPTITTQCFGYGNGRFGHPDQDRAISLREAAMLQGFPRDYSFIEDGTPVSFSKLGRLIGNAVPVTLGEVIGKVLTEHAMSVTSPN